MKNPKEVLIFYLLVIKKERRVINRNQQGELLRISVKKYISTIVNNLSLTFDLQSFNIKIEC